MTAKENGKQFILAPLQSSYYDKRCAAHTLIKAHFKHLRVFERSTNGLVCACENVCLTDQIFLTTVTDRQGRWMMGPKSSRQKNTQC